MTRTIKLKTVLPYPPEKVWLALTDAKLLGKWFMENDMNQRQGIISRSEWRLKKDGTASHTAKSQPLNHKNILPILTAEKPQVKKRWLVPAFILTRQIS